MLLQSSSNNTILWQQIGSNIHALSALVTLVFQLLSVLSECHCRYKLVPVRCSGGNLHCD